MSIRLLNLTSCSSDDFDEPDTVNVTSTISKSYLPLTNENTQNQSSNEYTSFSNDLNTDVGSVTSDLDISLHQAASEGSVDQVKRYITEIKNSFGEEKFVSERDRLNSQGFSPLHLAARYNRKSVVAYLLDEGASIEQKDGEHENTPLLLAAKYNMKHSAKFLIERHANPKVQNKYGTTALHFASRRGNYDLVKLLIELPHADLLNIEDNGKATPLHCAVLGGSEEVTKLLIQHGANVNAKDIEGDMPSHYAAAEDNGDLIVLLAKGALKNVAEADRELVQRQYVNAVNNEKDTALHIASQAGYNETVKTLVAIGANVNMKTDTRSTPLHLAAIGGQTEVVRFLVMSGAKINAVDSDYMTPLHRGAQFGRLATVQFLCQRGALVDAKDKDKFTPLMCAVWKGQDDAVEYLLDQGANIHLTEYTGRSVLHLAVDENNYSTLALLLHKGGVELVNTTDKDFKTPAHLAAAKGQEKMLVLLLNNGALLDVGDQEEKTPLHYAAEMGELDCVLVIGKAVPGIVNATDDRGKAPLHLATINGHIEVVQALIKMGAETSSRDDVNWTPLDYAARNDWPKTMQILLDNNAPVDAFDSNYMTPLHHASARGHVNCISLLLDNGASILLRNVDGKNCLDLAVENFERDACCAIISHKRWLEALRKPDNAGVHPMEKIIEVAPQVAAMVLDKCIEIPKNIPEKSDQYYEKFNFELLDINPDEQKGDWYSGPVTMVRHCRDNLLSHPLTVRLIDEKWRYMGRSLYMCSLVVYLLFVALLTTLVVQEKMNEKRYSDDLDPCLKSSKLTKIVPWLTLAVACFQILKEGAQVIYLGVRYLNDPVNWFEFALYGSTLLFMVPFIFCQFNSDTPSALLELKWPAGSISILFTWFNLLLYLKRFPVFGLYVVMFTEIFKTLIEVLLVFSILIIAFTLSFYALLNRQPDFKITGLSFVRTIVMMIGELDYDKIFTSNFDQSSNETFCNYENPGKHCLPYKGMTYFIFMLFMVIMSIIVMNLLVGLAVGDIESVRKSAYMRILKSRAKALQVLERSYPTFVLKYFYKKRINPLVIRPSERSVFERFVSWIKKIDAESLIKAETEMGGAENKLLREINLQKNELRKQKEKMKSLINMIEDQGLRTKQIAKKLKVKKEDLLG